jgi:hypothetical protein
MIDPRLRRARASGLTGLLNESVQSSTDEISMQRKDMESAGYDMAMAKYFIRVYREERSKVSLGE